MLQVCHALTVSLCLSFPWATAADDSPTPAARLKAVQNEVADADKVFRDAWAKLPDIHQDDPEVEKLFQIYLKKKQAGFATALDIAKADPKSATAFLALEWLLLQFAHQSPAGIPALEMMTTHHAANPKVGNAIAFVAYYLPGDKDPVHLPAIALLKAVVEQNPDATARGQAALGLAWDAKNRFKSAEYQGAPEANQLASVAETAFENVIRDYGACENLRTKGARKATKTIAGEAETELFELRRLRIGAPAPDIIGEDLGAEKLKLSDYRGKVCLLVFWASWCGPCMGAVPHERELVEHFQGRPFVLLGVNGDEKKDEAVKAVDKHKIPWRSFWNGTEGPGGPIAVAWNVRGWPTVYVIDHKGVIRHKYLHGKKLDDPLEKLVVEAEAAAKSKNE